MLDEIKEKFSIEKGLFILLIVGMLIVFGIIFYLFFGYASKRVEVTYPKGKDFLEVGKTYEIKWDARGADKVGIVLFDGQNPEWIAKDIGAGQGKYKWAIPTDHKRGSNFWIAIFEYPWSKGSKIDYSDQSFSITYPENSSCDELSVEKEWPYLENNFPGLRKVFLTNNSFNGNLDGFEGANKKCQEEAKEKGYEGNWVAFLGGDKDEETATSRLEQTTKKLGGIFVDAASSGELVNRNTCHKLLGKGLDEFIGRLSKLTLFGDNKSIWLGRLNDQSKRSCIDVGVSSYLSLKEKYSFTTTCQNWTQGSGMVPGYSEGMKLDSSFSSCYTPKGEFTYALALGGLDVTGKGTSCNNQQKLVCIED
jgi:hypothetical protein